MAGENSNVIFGENLNVIDIPAKVAARNIFSVKKQSFLTTSLSTLTLHQNYTSTQPKL